MNGRSVPVEDSSGTDGEITDFEGVDGTDDDWTAERRGVDFHFSPLLVNFFVCITRLEVVLIRRN